MTSYIHHTTVDSVDAYKLGSWWSEVLGAPLADDDFPGDPEVLLPAAGVLFVQVPEPKAGKNRIHFDLRPAEGATRDEEVERVLALGATVFSDLRKPDGTGWVTMHDIEGNEFCIVRSAAERGDGL